MHPVLFTFDVAGQLVTVRAYGVLLVAAALIALAGSFVLAVRAGLPKGRTIATLLVAGAGAFIGARLLNVALNRPTYADGWGGMLQPSLSGLSLYGGLTLACAVGVAAALALKVPAWRLLDATVPAVAAGLVLARIGCFLNGCCFGTPTDLPWGVSFPKGSLAWAYDATYGSINLFGGSSAVHPTQLYELGGVIVVCALALWWGASARSWRAAGTTFLVFAGLLSLLRLGVYFLRAPVFATQAPRWFYPVVYAAIAAACAMIVVYRSRAARTDVSVHSAL